MNYERVRIDGWSQLYVGDIDIIFENVSASLIFHNNEDEYLVTDNEEPISNSPSPLELQEVDQINRKEEEYIHQKEPFHPCFIETNASEHEIVGCRREK